MKVFTPVEEDFSVFFTHGASKDQVPGVSAAPDLRVAGVGAVADGRIGDRRDDHFFAVFVVKMISVLRADQELRGFKLFVQAGVRIFGIDDLIADAGIDEIKLPAFLDGASGEAAVLIRPGGGVEGKALMLPCDQVPAYGMSPVHGPPAGTIGEILIEKVVVSVVVYEAVRVIDPVVRRF